MPQLEDLRQRYVLDVSSVKREARSAKTAIDRLNREVDQGTRAFRRNARQAKKTALSMRLLKSVAREVQSAYRLALRRAGAAAVAALAVSLGKATIVAARFEKQIAEVSTLVDTASVSMRELSMNLLGVAQSIPVKIDDLTRGLYQLISASVPAGRAVEFLGVASRAAVAGVTSVETAVDGMTTVLNAWGKNVSDATDIADTFFVTVRDGKTTFEELSKNIGTVAPNAAALGITFEETASAIAAMTLQGLSTDKATVALRGFFSAILNPGQKALETANDLGLAWGEQAIKAKGLVKFLTDLREATAGNSTALARLVPNVRALTGVNAILGQGFGDLNRIMGDMEAKALAMEDAFVKMRRTTDGMWTLFKNQFNVAMIELGNRILPSVNEGLRTMLNWLADMRDPTDALINRLRDLGAEAGVLAELTALQNLQKAGRQVSALRALEGGGFVRRGRLAAEEEGFGGLFVAKPDVTATDELFDKITARAHDLSDAFDDPESALEKISELMKLTKERINEISKAERNLLNGKKAFIDGVEVSEESLKEETEAVDDQITKLLDAREAITLLIAARRTLKNLKEGRGEEPTEVPDEPTVTTLDESNVEQIRKARESFEAYHRELILVNQETDELREAHETLFARQDELRKLAEAESVLAERRTNAMREIGRLEAQRINLVMQGVSEDDEKIKKIDSELALNREIVETENERLQIARQLVLAAGQRVSAAKVGLNLQRPSAALQARMERLQSRLTNSTDKWSTTLSETLNTIRDIASLFGSLGDHVQSFVEGTAQIVTNLETLREIQAIKRAGEDVRTGAQLTATLGVIGGGVAIGSAFLGLVNALESSEEEQRRLRDEFRRTGKTFSDSVQDLISAETPGAQVSPEDLELARRAARQGARGAFLGPVVINAPGFRRLLSEQEVIDAISAIPGFEDFGSLVEQLMASADITRAEAIERAINGIGATGVDILAALESIQPGLSGISAAGAARDIEFGRQFLGDTIEDSFQRLIDFFERFGEQLPEDLRKEFEKVSGLDLSDPADRAAFEAFVKSFAESIFAGETFGMTGEEAERWLDLFQSIVNDFEDVETDQISRSVLIARTITEIQANELIAIQESALLTLERILEAVRTSGAESGSTYNISISIPEETTDFGRRILEEIEHEIRLKEAS